MGKDGLHETWKGSSDHKGFIKLYLRRVQDKVHLLFWNEVSIYKWVKLGNIVDIVYLIHQGVDSHSCVTFSLWKSWENVDSTIMEWVSDHPKVC